MTARTNDSKSIALQVLADFDSAKSAPIPGGSPMAITIRLPIRFKPMNL
jgi:hypothetical protein